MSEVKGICNAHCFNASISFSHVGVTISNPFTSFLPISSSNGTNRLWKAGRRKQVTISSEGLVNADYRVKYLQLKKIVIEKVQRYCGKLISTCRRGRQMRFSPHIFLNLCFILLPNTQFLKVINLSPSLRLLDFDNSVWAMNIPKC